MPSRPIDSRQAKRLQYAMHGLALGGALMGGCATIRVTDPPRTATELFLLNTASQLAVRQLSTTALRDRKVFIDTSYLTSATQPSLEHSFLIGEVRARLLMDGVRLVSKREAAQIVLELRTAGVSADRTEFLLGIPATYIPGSGAGTGGVAIATPELAIIKSTKQRGFTSVAYVAYWAESGELIASSGPVVGRTWRDDWWFFGTGPRTLGNIPPAEKIK